MSEKRTFTKVLDEYLALRDIDINEDDLNEYPTIASTEGYWTLVNKLRDELNHYFIE